MVNSAQEWNRHSCWQSYVCAYLRGSTVTFPAATFTFISVD